MTRLALAVTLGAIAGCGGPDGDETGPAVDSTLVEVLVDLQLAEARAERDGLDPDSARALTAVALASHDVDSTGLDARLADLSRDPEAAAALAAAVTDRLTQERQSSR